jgi:hypothetical protein
MPCPRRGNIFKDQNQKPRAQFEVANANAELAIHFSAHARAQ